MSLYKELTIFFGVADCESVGVFVDAVNFSVKMNWSNLLIYRFLGVRGSGIEVLMTIKSNDFCGGCITYCEIGVECLAPSFRLIAEIFCRESKF